MAIAVDRGAAASSAGARARPLLAFVGLTAARWVLGLGVSLVLWAVVPAAFGWESAVVMTGSMEPGLPVGSVVVAEPASPDTVRPGVIVLADFPGRPGELLTHRMVRSTDDGIVTRGDANPTEDSAHVPVDSVRGVVRLVVPLVGQVAVWWQAGAYWHLAAVAGVLLVSAVVVLADLMRARPGRPGRRSGRPAGVTAWGAVCVVMATAAGVLVVAPADAAFAAVTSNPNNRWGTSSSFVFAKDTFNGRTVSGGLGSADIGGAWNYSIGQSRMSVSDYTASLGLNNAGDLDSAHLSPTTAAALDVTGYVSFTSVPDGGGAYGYLIGRRVGTNQEYRARVRVYRTDCGYNCTYRSIGVAVTRLNGSTSETVIGSEATLGFQYDLSCSSSCGTTGSGNMNLNMHLVVSSTATSTRLTLTVWRRGSTEPSSPTVNVTDSTAALQAAGAVGIAARLSGSATSGATVDFHDFLAQKGTV